MATKYIAYGGCPPGVSQTSHSLHTAVLQGIAVFFSSTLFFLFLHPFSQNSTYCRLHALVFWRAHFLCVPSMALILLVQVQSRVFTAKCSEPQAGVSNGRGEGSGVAKFLSLRKET